MQVNLFTVYPRFEIVVILTSITIDKSVKYTGRDPSASVATGNKKRHFQEEYDLLGWALLGEPTQPKEIISGIPVW